MTLPSFIREHNIPPPYFVKVDTEVCVASVTSLFISFEAFDYAFTGALIQNRTTQSCHTPHHGQTQGL